MMEPLEHLRMIKESAAGISPRKGDLKRIRALRFTEPGFDRATWREMCEMGWLGLLLPEDDGGSGLGAREFCGLAEELGAGLTPEPLIPAAMAALLLPPDHLAPVLLDEVDRRRHGTPGGRKFRGNCGAWSLAETPI